ncbi:MAG TPA: PspC domain-containing protein [Kineosporiaceae bacterium]|nr:PspC domain-containing protein [Kineosporiaceae bacterium]
MATTSKQGTGRQDQAVAPARAAWTPPPVVPVVPPARPPLVRPASGRVLAGVAAGLAAHLGVPVRVVRIGLVVGVVLGGVGAVLYLWLWALVPSAQAVPGVDAPAMPAGAPTPASASAPASVRGAPWAGPPAGRVGDLLVGGLLLLAGGALLGQRFGYDISLSIVLPLLVVLGGAVLAYTQLDEVERSRWASIAGGSTRSAVLRVVAGLCLVLIGVVLVVVQGDLASAGRVLVAAVAVLGGAAVVLAPWGLRLWRDLDAERAARAREAERSEIAAHLHDSVLQTLALIQRRSDDPVQVARLARAQERDLRSWLYGGDPVDAGSVAAQVKAAAAEVEDRHGASIEVVVVGDRPADDRTSALVAALREAMVNAVKHGQPTSFSPGQVPVQVYVEATADGVEAFVRDRGCGFDLDAVPADRLGVRESIVARMQRHGGGATVRSTAGEGTEVRLEMPADPAEATA